MSIQYSIVAIIVIAIIIWQVTAYIKNRRLINQLRKLFPNVDKLAIDKDGRHIWCSSSSADFEESLQDINAYLEENRNRTPDYPIIKEIVERNSQKLEDDVDAMLSIPLYLGLMATISGAAVGIIFFAHADLEGLLTGTTIEAGGIKTLLTDIGIAMAASFLGVFFTARSTSKYKEAKGQMSKYRNQFLTWIQTKVMPNVADDLSGALTKMAQDLNMFNSTFAENTRELKETLSQVTDNYDNQVQLLEAIDKIKINKIARANVEVYDKLQGCTDELEKLFEHLEQSESYIANVVELNSRLGDIEERTKLSEELGQYFQSEIEFVRDRQGMMRQQISGLDSVMREAFDNLGLSLSKSITGLTDVFQKQNQQVQMLIEEQQTALTTALEQQRGAINNKIAEINDPFGGLKETFKEVGEQSRQGIESISATFENQNSAIRDMLASQRQLLENELNTNRESIKQQMASMPGQMNELAKVLKELNQLVSNQQSKIDSQNQAIQQLMSQLTGENPTPISGWKSWLLPIGVCGSFVLLLAILIVKLFGISI